MRSVLHTPVPKVLSWDSSKNNPVGAEYIIMEKAPGVQLDQIWNQLDIGEMWKVTQSIAKYQALWAEVSFAQFGSLYYKQDLASAQSLVCYHSNGDAREVVTNEKFAVGPSTSRQTADDGRLGVDFDIGPCKCSGRRRFVYEVALTIAMHHREHGNRIRNSHRNKRNQSNPGTPNTKVSNCNIRTGNIPTLQGEQDRRCSGILRHSPVSPSQR